MSSSVVRLEQIQTFEIVQEEIRVETEWIESIGKAGKTYTGGRLS